MNDFLKKIYENVISQEEHAIQMDQEIDQKIKIIKNKYEGKMSSDEIEELSGYFYYIALCSKQKGFQLGMECLVKIINSIWFES